MGFFDDLANNFKDAGGGIADQLKGGVDHIGRQIGEITASTRDPGKLEDLFGATLGFAAGGPIGAILGSQKSIRGENLFRSPQDFLKGIFRPVDEAVGELTGRNQGREALYKADVRLQQEAQSRAKLLKDQQKQKELMDISASGAAESARNTNTERSGANPFLNYQDSPSYQKDFLGL